MRRGLPRSAPVNPLGLLFLILALIVGLAGFWLWQTGKFGKFERFNLVIATEPVTLVSLDKSSGSATVVSLPSDLQIFEVVPNYGAYPISAVYKLGQLDNRGGQVLSWTVGELLGVPVDGYLVKSGSKLGPDLVWASASNLNFLDRVRFAFEFWRVRFDKTNKVDLGKMAEPLVLADGATGRAVEKTALDSFLAGDFVEANLRNEGLRVEVVNSTPTSGLGQRAARVLTNIGVEVISVGSSTDFLPNCEVWVRKKDQGTQTVKRLTNIFSCKVVVKEELDRADVSLVLGRDFSDRYQK